MDAARVAAVDRAWQRVARERGVTVLDLNAKLCPGGVTDPTIRPDGAHFDGSGADAIAPLVANAVHKAIAARPTARTIPTTTRP
jgi:lysophospholipase L1-like esterase